MRKKTLKDILKGKSPGGSEIYEYTEPESSGLQMPEAVGVYADEICAHFEGLFPDRETVVFHEIVSHMIHLDVNIMQPTEEDPFYVVYTTGMSDLPMTLPEELVDGRDFARAELMMFLPDTWQHEQALQPSPDNEPNPHYWPIHMIKYLARFPHEYQTWLGWGHTIPNGPDYEPITAGTEMGGVVLGELDDRISPVITDGQDQVHIYMVIPAYKEEIEYKLEYGMQALDRLFADNNMPVVIDIHRKNYCKL